MLPLSQSKLTETHTVIPTIILVTTDSSPSPDYQSEMNLTHKIFSREIHSAPSRATGCRLEPSHVSNEEILPHSAQRMPLQRLLCNVPVANEFHCRERSANSPVGFCSEQPPVGGMIKLYLIRAISKQPLRHFAPKFLAGFLIIIILCSAVPF